MDNISSGDAVFYRLDGYIQGVYRGRIPGGKIVYDDDGHHDYVIIESQAELEEYKDQARNGEIMEFQELDLDVVEVNNDLLIVDPDRNRQVIPKSEVDNFFCKEIKALVHGTNDIIPILESGSIKIGDGRASGVAVPTVSTYPILDCDTGHSFSKSDLRGKYFIFMDPRVLERAKHWIVTLMTDSAGGAGAADRYDVNTKILYFERISKYRVNVWSDTPQDGKLFHGDDANRNSDYIGELAIYNKVNLKGMILYIAVPEDDIVTIDQLLERWPEIKVVPYRDDLINII